MDDAGRYEEAILCYDQSIALDGNYEEAYYSSKGVSLCYLCRLEEAGLTSEDFFENRNRSQTERILIG